jgi:Predicted endonuclease distantly related to archaeal Holliday junction resolvase
MKERKLDRLEKNWLRITLSGSAIRFFNSTSVAVTAKLTSLLVTRNTLSSVKSKQGIGSTPLHPSLSVTKAKDKRIRELVSLYLMEHEDETRQPRFDIISVIMHQNHEGTIEHLENAF